MRKLKTGQTTNSRTNDQRVPNVLRGLQESAFEAGSYKLNREVNTGQIWIDGRTIYRTVIDLGSLPNATTKNIAHGIGSFSFMLPPSGVATNGDSIRPLPYVDTGTGNLIELRADPTNVNVVTAINYSSYTAYAILEYTR